LFEEAAELGPLVVGINSDASFRAVKGRDPIFAERHREYMVAMVKPVLATMIFVEDTPIELIKALKPMVLVKGADWKEKDIVGAEFVRSYGGKVVRVPLYDAPSTSDVLAIACKLR
jgi:rfaE bifunctional protein nucleotidyltransferase chain/domain